MPLARVVAEHRTLPKFFKRYQIQPVWRADRPARGRFREFYQCDVDVLGSTSPVVEAELCAAAAEALLALGFTDFTIRLNHRQLLTALLEVAGVPADKHSDALIALDKLGKITPDEVIADMEARGIARPAADASIGLFLTDFLVAGVPSPTNADVFAALRTKVGDHAAGQAALDNLAAVERLSAATPAGGRLQLDPSLARGLSYYTGAIMEIAVPDLAGSLGGGGRYDNLVGMFRGEQVPACGFSLGLERILVVMGERGMFPPDLEASRALPTSWCCSGAKRPRPTRWRWRASCAAPMQPAGPGRASCSIPRSTSPASSSNTRRASASASPRSSARTRPGPAPSR